MESPLSFFSACIGTMNLTLRQNLFGVPPSGGPDRLKPGHQTVGSWKVGLPPRPSPRPSLAERETSVG